MPIGLALPQYGVLADPTLTARVAAEAEAIGYDRLWTADRILVPNEPRSRYPGGDGTIPAEFRTFLDPLTLLTVAAGATTRARLGTSTLNALWQPPALLARTLTTIDRLSGGRLDVGIGLGWSKDEYQAVGVPWEGKAARLEETLDVLEAFWAGGEDVRHTGALWTVPPSTVLSLPVQRPRPPVLLGGVSPAALERAGRRSDGWLGIGLPMPALHGIRDQLHRAAHAAGRDPLALRLILRANPVITATPAPAEQVPQRGTVGQIAEYFTTTIRQLGAEPLLDLHHAARSADEYLALAREFHDALGA
ncbi:TIGR03619 family F420-dependent LLM class oxidoreductase [Kitasatospora sp. NPDC056184]|uniref:TIGR03619 family F420-dependent LLM class oxidoreductase n=1 Tax=Kitasatospora sp. NPDC056184 TaxID=3345738 RepID=UPI0035DC7141